MSTSTKTRLEVANSVLTTCGERPLTSSGGTIGTVVNDCIKDALQEVCTSNAWNELRATILGTWSGDRATLNDRVYRVQDVLWYSSPTGTAQPSYDYPYYGVQFITLNDFVSRTSTPYTNSQSNTPRYWTLESSNVVRVNPYPNDATERNKIRFVVFQTVDFPSTDSNYFNCSDRLLNIIQWCAAANYALKFLSDTNTYMTLTEKYEKLRRKLLVSDSALPTSGYTIFRGRRG